MCPFQEVGGEGRKEPQRVSSNLASEARRVYPSEGKRGDEAAGAVLGVSERPLAEGLLSQRRAEVLLLLWWL